MNESILPSVNYSNFETAKPGRALVALALVLALASLGGSSWIWWQSQHAVDGAAEHVSAELQRRGDDLTRLESRLGILEAQVSNLAAADSSERLGKVEQGVASLQSSVGNWQSWQAETAASTRSMQAAIEGDQARLAGAEARLAVLSARDMSSSAQLDLAEVAYVVRLAQERLQLFGDTRTAAQALKIADQQIAASDNPSYIALQREIAEALQKLSLVKEPDYPALYRSIDTLQSDLFSLPFKGQGSPAEATTVVEDTGWWARIRQAFSGLVTVRRSTGDENATPVLADQELIRQQAWLELEVARLAAMRRDRASWSAALNRLSALLERWFEPSGFGLQGVQTLLDTLQAADVDPPMPDISAPWVTLQAIRNSGAPVPSRQETTLPPATEPDAATAIEVDPETPAPTPADAQPTPEKEGGESDQ